MPTSNFQPIRSLDPDYWYKFTHLWQTEQIQISWLLQKPTDLDLHCLQRQGISRLSRTRVNMKKQDMEAWKGQQALFKLGMLGKTFSRWNFEMFFLIFPENRV